MTFTQNNLYSINLPLHNKARYSLARSVVVNRRGAGWFSELLIGVGLISYNDADVEGALT